MAKTSLGEKAARVLNMMLGLRNKRVMAAMTAYGFTDADLEEGWALLQALSAKKVVPLNLTVSSDVLDKLDAWENRWFPIADVTLANRAPGARAELFKNLSQTSGPAVALSVRTFVERFDAMAAGTAPFGSDGQAAVSILEARGLTKAVLDEARALLESLGKVDVTDVATIEEDKADLAKAEEKLWAWYLEWSQIARIAIKQRSLLRALGFVSGRRSSSAAEPTVDVDPVTGVITPVQDPTG